MMETTLLESIERNIRILKMNFQDESWRDPLPSGPGWYFIETNTPPEKFKKDGDPKGERHYHIPGKAKASLSLEQVGGCILPSENSFYFVYSGEAKNLKARAREHVSGHDKTGCLELRNYPLLYKYEWNFHFSPCFFCNNSNESKLIRIFGEQLWRAKYGWPILCGK